jgi:glycosyltransferase involved in cell wall biosynthesis
VQRHAEAVSMLHHVEILHAIGDENQVNKFVFDDQIINGIRTLIIYYKNTKNPIKNFLRRMNAYRKGFAKMQKPDLVHANVLHNSMLFAVYLKKKHKIPFVITEHWTAYQENASDAHSKPVRLLSKYIGNQSSYILPVSKNLENGLRVLGIKIPMKVIPNVIDTDLFFVKDKSNDLKTFIHVSNLIPRKNPEKILKVALKLFEKAYQFRIQIGGDGDDSDLKKIAQNSNYSDKIEIFGIQTLKQIGERMSNSNCFILLSDNENQPCVISEAFASGINVISTNVGGISEFFPENFGILLPNVDEDLLEKAMIQFLNNGFKASKEEIRDYACTVFSKEIIAKSFSFVYQSVLEK